MSEQWREDRAADGAQPPYSHPLAVPDPAGPSSQHAPGPPAPHQPSPWAAPTHGYGQAPQPQPQPAAAPPVGYPPAGQAGPVAAPAQPGVAQQGMTYPGPAYPAPSYPGARPAARGEGALPLPVQYDVLPGTPFGLALVPVPPTSSGPAWGSLATGIGSILVSFVVGCFAAVGAEGGWGPAVAGAFALLAVFAGWPPSFSARSACARSRPAARRAGHVGRSVAAGPP